jgi:hypothetical protein
VCACIADTLRSAEYPTGLIHDHVDGSGFTWLVSSLPREDRYERSEVMIAFWVSLLSMALAVTFTPLAHNFLIPLIALCVRVTVHA